jgi:hypothetical protein
MADPAAESDLARHFGVTRDRKLLDPVSFYKVPAEPSAQDRLCFDVSNNYAACSVNDRGLVERLAIQLGVEPVETRTTPVGAYLEKVLLRFGPWPISLRQGSEPAIRLDHLDPPEIQLVADLFPVYIWRMGGHSLAMTVFAPQAGNEAPPAIFLRFTVIALQGAAEPIFVASSTAAMGENCAVLCEQGGHWEDLAGDRFVEVGSGTGATCTFALVLGSSEARRDQTRDTLRQRSAEAWWSSTRDSRMASYGSLTIPEAPFYAELLTRAVELSRQSLLVDESGHFGGSFNGSDLPTADNVWLRDCFYSTYPQTIFAPDLAAKGILFFLHWSIPAHVLGEHAAKFPGASGVTNSLGNSVAGIVLAGTYWAHTADRSFFLAHPEILTRSTDILEQVLASRLEEVYLFPSIYVSDGESRGDYHTGSNIFVWKAMTCLSRLAGEVYSKPESAKIWQTNARLIHDAILKNCVVEDSAGPRFVEAAMQDHTRISGHDGEESDVTLAAVYGFCAPEDAAYLNAASYAISAANPYAIEELEGIWWYAHGKWSSATFPGWITALASSANEAEMTRHLERIRTLTDADGSFWWWPYPHTDAPNVSMPLRTNSKCGWAAGTFASYFLRHVLGLSIDVPQQALTFSPFAPWSEFNWRNARLGSMLFDCISQDREGVKSLEIRNHQRTSMRITLRLILPPGTEAVHAVATPGGSANTGPDRYGRPTVETVQTAAPGESVRLEVLYRKRL